MDWQLPSTDIRIDDALREAVGGHPLVAEILARRGLTDPARALAFLDPARYRPASPDDLPDLCAAAERLLHAVRNREQVLVWGDFDVDGQTATALLVDALRRLGANVRYHIPRRLEHGHGVQIDVLREHLSRGVDVLLTCDTGIAAHEAVGAARAAGVDVLVTDHHALPPTLPDAHAVVNPQRLPEGHPLRDLPGVGVAYKLVEKLYDLAGRAGEEQDLLDLVALGIVADVATLRGDTRYLLQLGLDRLRDPRRVGLQALFASAQVVPTHLSADTIGFQVGPRLNALGRLDDAALAVKLLTTSDRETAQQISAQLERLNDLRKQLQDQIVGAALAQVEKDPALLDFEALVLAGENWHAGVLGIVAARLVELYNRPAVVLTCPPGEPARGSARSVPGVDIGAAIAACADLLVSHGGHPGAAGLALDPDLIPQFRRRLSNAIAKTRDPSVRPVQQVDAVVSLADVTDAFAAELNRLAPFGEGNPPVQVMVPRLVVRTSTTFGLERQHRRVTVVDETGRTAVVTWWRGADSPLPQTLFDLLFIPRFSDYKGSRTLELEWVASRPTPGVVIEPGTRREVIDLRREPSPRGQLPADGFAVWAEAAPQDALPFPTEQLVDRHSIQPVSDLVIWSTPPGPLELQEMIEASRARRFYLVGEHRPPSDPDGFARRLAGLAKYAIEHYPDGVGLRQIAAAMGQREITVRRGLEWLAAKGMFGVEWLPDDQVRITPGGNPDPEAAARLWDSVTALLREAAAFQQYFLRADLSAFFEGEG
ncbi:MAG TPA: single-stranded-DNA-specific exonuclease RecJ [Aggregatilineales bacterium]|nr:single-stranded-DNA-specific exonuclease RecJ [Chloroflexota bacterium]HOA25130.1 single-stranded-DNA-specific exonuclease RecJ [Aggregatilineales bacterium]HQA67839.1 single-stranded-DNA-specific exonuclease RecJ [Aggregatilineales bacterium]HQE18212.1 single-stranded-DNA-specific exonuclease RecJ [Aggregatilineales bacterium]